MNPRSRRAAPTLAFAALCYLPLLLTAPGVVVADTKTYLYLDPGKLLSRAASMWDPFVGLGTVTHQNIGYLWPMGPFYWLAELLALPDWVAQRLWLGSILFLAGLGMRYLLRTFGWSGPSVAAATVAYALSPYVLTVAARISVILLPFTALPWMLGLTIRALRTGSWRYPALLALVVATAGTGNATAILLAGIGPLLVVPFLVWVTREIALRSALATVGRIALLGLLVNAWWIAGLSVQATNGLNVLAYSETAEVTSSTSLSQEVLRGLGYWFFYGDDRLGPWIEPSVQYTQEIWVLVATFTVPVLALVGAALGRWRYRAFFIALLTVGTVLAVGAHPWDSPSPLGRVIKAVLLSDAGLALRSLPRAAPLVALSLAVLLGAGVHALIERRPSLRTVVTVVAVLLPVVALAPLWQRSTVPENLRRDEDVPAYWVNAGRFLDRTDDGTRVLEIPGADFASYRWGNTVDAITPGLTHRPTVARELLPQGSPAGANLLGALDRALQTHLAEPAALAPIARAMRAGQVLLRSDLQYERYFTPRPTELWSLVRRAAGLGDPMAFGRALPNVADPELPMHDELYLSLGPDLPPPPPVAVLPVDGALPIVAAKPVDSPLIVAGDGHGLVDAAAAGLIDGNELLRYSAAMDDEALDTSLEDDAVLLVTDTNRRRGTRWTSVRFTQGYTEPAGLDPLERDLTDNRLPVFPDAGDASRTVALHRGGITANATSYGNPAEFVPAERPILAVDGDPATAWRTGAFSRVEGERLRIDLDEPAAPGTITLLAPQGDDVNRWFTEVRLRFDGRDPLDVSLGSDFLGVEGQVVDVGARRFRRLEIEVLADTAGDRPRYGGLTSTGFAEVRIGDLVADEAVRPPVDLLSRAGDAALDHDLAILLTRLRTAPTDALRSDEERSLVRALALPTERAFSLGGQVRLSPRAPDELVDRLVGVRPAERGGTTVRSSGHLAGVEFRGGAALDRDVETAWTTPFGAPEGDWIEATGAAPLLIDRVALDVVADGDHSVPAVIGIEVDGERVATVDLPEIDDAATRGTTVTVEVPLPEPVRGRTVRLVLEEVRRVTTVDWYRRVPVAMPVAIAEWRLPGIAPITPAEQVATGCRSDLLAVDGEPVPVTIRGSTAGALAGQPLALATCEGAPVALPAGEATLRSAEGATTGLDVDRLVLRSGAGGGAQPPGAPLVAATRGEGDTGAPLDETGGTSRTPTVEVIEDGHARVRVAVTDAGSGEPFWLSFGQSHNEGWRASIAGESLGDPVLVDGFANGWRIEPSTSSFTVDLEFVPQRRVRLALWVSLVAALGCVAIAALARRRPVPGRPDEVPAAMSTYLASTYHGRRPDRRAVIGLSLGLGVLAALVLHPLAGPVIGAVAAVASTRPRSRRWLTLGAPLAMAAAGAYVVAWQIRYDIPPGIEWPSEFSRAHPLAWLAVLVLLTDAAVHRAWGGETERERR